jgi:hypothetical protein
VFDGRSRSVSWFAIPVFDVLASLFLERDSLTWSSWMKIGLLNPSPTVRPRWSTNVTRRLFEVSKGNGIRRACPPIGFLFKVLAVAANSQLYHRLPSRKVKFSTPTDHDSCPYSTTIGSACGQWSTFQPFGSTAFPSFGSFQLVMHRLDARCACG